MHLNIHSAVPEQAAAIARMNQMMALETEDKSLAEETLVAGVKSMLQDPTLGFYLVASDARAEEPAAAVLACLAITYEWSDWRNGLFWWIQSVYVDPQHRGKGVFSQMYQTVKDLAREDARSCGIRLYVEQDNQRALSTYLHIGMRETPYRLLEEVF